MLALYIESCKIMVLDLCDLFFLFVRCTVFVFAFHSSKCVLNHTDEIFSCALHLEDNHYTYFDPEISDNVAVVVRILYVMRSSNNVVDFVYIHTLCIDKCICCVYVLLSAAKLCLW